MQFFNFLIRWFAENKIASNSLMLLIFAAAFILTPNIAKQIFPDAQLPGFVISSIYPGASTQTVERDVCIPIENAIRDTKNINRAITNIKNQSCIVTVFIKDFSKRETTLTELQSNINAINNLPNNAQKPKINNGEIKKYVTRIIISGDTKLPNLYNLSQRVIQELNALGLSSIHYEHPIHFNTIVEISKENLKKHRITLAEIAALIQANNKNISSGEIENTAGRISIQSLSNARNINELKNIRIRSYPDGGTLQLRDIAKISIHSTEDSNYLFYDGHQAIALIVEQGGNKNLSNASQIVHRYIKQKKPTLPKSINIDIDNDAALLFNARISMLLENALFGLLLVFITLLFFLNFKLALWVSIGIPIAFSGSLIVLYLTGDSLNMISTFAFLLVLGIIVDDAIVISESIYDQQKNYVRGTEGAIIGTSIVARPVLYAVLTTIVMFTPLLFVPGSEGVLLSSIPIIAISAIVFSIIECLFILPSHLSADKPQKKSFEFNQKFKTAFEHHIKTTFKTVLAFILKWRYITIAIFLVLFACTFSLISSGWVKTRLISTIEADEAFARLELPEGTSINTTKKYVALLENSAQQLKEQLKEQYKIDQIKHIRTQLGVFGSHTAMVFLTFPSRDARKISSKDVAELWRKRVGEIDIATRLEFSAVFNQPGPSIDIQLISNNKNELLRATQELHSLLDSYPAAYGVQNNIKRGNQEISLRLKPSASLYQINTQQLAAVVNEAFHGIYLDDSSHPDRKIIVRLPNNERNKIWHLERLLVPTQSGAIVPVNKIADINFYTGDSEIIHYNFQRSQNVSAFIDENIASSSAIFADLEQRFLNKLSSSYPSVSWKKAGALEIGTDTKHSLIYGFLIAALCMYLLLIFLFKSIAKPSIVLSAVPFGLVGALLGHWILGYDITLWSFAGMIAVSGVVVNDNVVLVDYINQESKQQPQNITSAILNAGSARFRPILLTSLTTIIGLIPIMFETSWEAQFLIPMVISIAFGELFATFISLLFVPCLYMVYTDVNGFFQKTRPL